MALLLLLFVIVPVAELYVIVQVGHVIGFLNTFALIILIAFIGSWLMKREGLRVWRSFNQTLGRGEVPAREIVDGVLVLAAGALMLAPGFITDVVGLFVIFPPTRALIRKVVLNRAKFVEVNSRYRGGFIDVDENDVDVMQRPELPE